jgi:pimeloyl-ACP methyl ester carboxylesterase
MNDERIRLEVDGGEVVLTIDAPEREEIGHVVLVPPFGMSAQRLFPAAYLLASNGLRVFRFDPRDHPGDSTGTIETFKMSGLVRDLSAVLDHTRGGIVMAISLSARSVLRALAGRSDVPAAVLLTPVVNVRYTLTQVFGYDLFQRIYAGEGLPPRLRVVGYDVSTEFVQDCIDSGLVGVDDAARDVAASAARTIFIAGDADPWVAIDDVRQVVRHAGEHGARAELAIIQAASHQLYRNPVLAMSYLQTATSECLRVAGADPAAAVFPPFAQIVAAVEDVAERRRAARREEVTHV